MIQENLEQTASAELRRRMVDLDLTQREALACRMELEKRLIEAVKVKSKWADRATKKFDRPYSYFGTVKNASSPTIQLSVEILQDYNSQEFIMYRVKTLAPFQEAQEEIFAERLDNLDAYLQFLEESIED